MKNRRTQLSRSTSVALFMCLAATIACGSSDAVGPGQGSEVPDAMVGGGDVGDDTGTVFPDTSGPGPVEPTPDDAGPGPDPSPTDTDLGPDIDPTDGGVTDAVDLDVGPEEVDTADTGPGPDLGVADPFRNGSFLPANLTDTVPRSDSGTFPAQIYLPGETSAAPFPVVIFNHGFQLEASNYPYIGRRMATHGFVVVMTTVGDGIFSARAHRRLALDTSALIDWLEEQNADASADLFGLLDLDRVGVSGHSRGGKVAILAATLDDRIQAVFTLDPVDTAGGPGSRPSADNPSVTPELMDGLTVPTGYVGAGRGAQARFPGAPPCAPSDENYQEYFDESPSPAHLYRVVEGGHNDFADPCTNFTVCNACAAGADESYTREVAMGMMVAFFKLYLTEDERYALWVSGAELADRLSDDTLQYDER